MNIFLNLIYKKLNYFNDSSAHRIAINRKFLFYLFRYFAQNLLTLLTIYNVPSTDFKAVLGFLFN